MIWTIKRHDLRTRYRVQLTHADPVNPNLRIPADLSGATSVKFLMKSDAVMVQGPASFVDRAAGLVEYDFEPGDTDTVGDYNIEFEVMWGTDPQTFPSEGYFAAKITPDLG